MERDLPRRWLGRVTRLALPLVLAVPLLALPGTAAAQAPVVHAVLFFSPTCGHCEYVINEVLPVVFADNGGEPTVRYDTSLPVEEVAFYLMGNGSLEILLVDASVPAGGDLYGVATDRYAIPRERQGVPRLVVADTYMVGSREIPERFPGMVAEGLAQGGIDWPDLPSLTEALASVPPEDGGTTTTTGGDSTTTTTTIAGSTTSAQPTPTEPTTTTTQGGGPVLPGEGIWDRFHNDTAANILALVVLAAMVASMAAAALLWRRGGPPVLDLLIPALAVLGAGVAAYLAYVEGTGSQAVCGPVGNCNAVQQSEYALLFGMIPVGMVGLVGYGAVIAAWVAARLGRGALGDWARVFLFAGAVAGTAFSIYLTVLEPFVIGATCAWCLTSAVIVTALMLLTAGPAGETWRRPGAA